MFPRKKAESVPLADTKGYKTSHLLYATDSYSSFSQFQDKKGIELGLYLRASISSLEL